MNPKQLACVILMAFIGVITYVGQIVHKKVKDMKTAAQTAVDESKAADDARQLADILLTKAKGETDELRRFLKTWSSSIGKIQTEQEMEAAVEYTNRERGITLVKASKTETKTNAADLFMPKLVISTITIEDEYAKVLNWLGDIEKRLPLARVVSCQITGGSSVRQIELTVTLESPIINLAAKIGKDATKKS
ncbi:MAG: hypothetical protein NTV80_02420 [Verrucomicrobia bacterium]|nr:hypothetical protein [Verrucomicrobiota bacterium]